MALVNKRIERVIFDVDPGTSNLSGVQLVVSADVEEAGEFITRLERVKNVWPDLTAQQKTGFQNMYDRLLQLR